MPFAAGDRVGPYEIVALAGEGAMGAVYRARDVRLGRTVALKCVRSKTPGAVGSGPTPGVTPCAAADLARARIIREARAASALNHPHVCTVYDVGEAAGEAWIAMEFVDGQPLSALVAHPCRIRCERSPSGSCGGIRPPLSLRRRSPGGAGGDSGQPAPPARAGGG
jgi:serine/threonine protein kinase